MRSDLTGWRRQDVLSQRHVRGGDQLCETVVHHSRGTVAGLLSRLEQRDQGAVPVVITGQ